MYFIIFSGCGTAIITFNFCPGQYVQLETTKPLLERGLEAGEAMYSVFPPIPLNLTPCGNVKIWCQQS